MTETSVRARSRLSRFLDEMIRGYRAQSAVVFALIFKDLRVDAMRGRLGIAWTLAEPIIQMSVMAGLWAPTGVTSISGVPIFLFLAAGVIPYIAVRQSMTVVGLAIRRSEGFFDYPQVKPFDTVIASFIYEMTLLLISAVLFILAFAWFRDIAPAYPDPLGLAYVLALLMMLCLGLGLLLGTYAALFDDLAKMASVLTRPLLFVSAVFFSMNQLPAAARKILAWNPLAQIIEHIRHYMLGMPLFPEASLEYMTLSSIMIFCFGVIVYAANRFKLIQK